ncbi:MAG: DUF1206 domain-containing protein [Rhodobacteraceae bacterium]|nr:DUF1206 domain-containing protein [Paracoccaceae bacterium]
MPDPASPPDTRSRRLDGISPGDFAWAVPIMRTGYAGRGLVYLLVAGVSLWSIWHGGEAEGTQEAMDRLQGGWGSAVLALIALGMFAYAAWRAVDSIWDLEAYGSNLKGLVARAGMITTGLVHLGLGLLAIAALLGRAEDSGQPDLLSRVLAAPAGQIAVGIAGALTVAAGGYYLYKAWKESYRDHLKGNPATLHLNMALKAGVASHGVAIAIIGLLILRAAAFASSHQAGGLGTAFDWLQDRAYGQMLVVLLCLGLLGFALFCFVNAAYRIVPKADDRGTKSLRDALSRS